MHVSRGFSWTAARSAEHVGLFAAAGPMTYAQWNARVNQIAHALLAAGVAANDRIAMFLSNSEVLASTHLAAQKIGATSAPLNIRLSVDELAYCLNDAQPSLVIVDDVAGEVAYRALESFDATIRVIHAGQSGGPSSLDFDQCIEGQPDSDPAIDVAADATSVLLYTSGTTGRPKGVPRSQAAEWHAALAHVIQHRYVTGERTLGAMPMYHTMGLRSLLAMIVLSGTFVALPVFKPQRALELINDHDITSLYLVPTAFWTLHATGALGDAATSVSRISYAGAAMTSSLTNDLVTTLQPTSFVNHYGSSEIYSYTYEPFAGEKPGSAGRAGVFSRVRLVDPTTDDQTDVVTGQAGEIIASLGSPEAFTGYWHRPDADEKSLRNGWFHTGDLGMTDDRGDLHVVGRVDDMIITGGENVHPVEVEDVLAACDDIAEVAVAGLPDEKWGQAVTAFIVPSGAPDPAMQERITEWIRTANMSPYKRPKNVTLVREIPKSPVGKILRRKLVAGEFEPLEHHSPD